MLRAAVKMGRMNLAFNMRLFGISDERSVRPEGQI
jgi:hypothetical protein